MQDLAQPFRDAAVRTTETSEKEKTAGDNRVARKKNSVFYAWNCKLFGIFSDQRKQDKDSKLESIEDPAVQKRIERIGDMV